MLLKDKLKPYRLLLASQSPRRRELMTGCGLPYELAPKYECEEVYPAGMPGEEVPLYLSRLKSEAYPAALAPNEILLTADTVVVSDGEVLGKPLGREEAVQMLRPGGCIAGAGTLRPIEQSHKEVEAFSSEAKFTCANDTPYMDYLPLIEEKDKIRKL